MKNLVTGPDRRAGSVELLFRECRWRLLAIARRETGCVEDARDALQRGFEIALRKAPVTDRDRLFAWMTVVVRREAMLIRRQRQRVAPWTVKEGEGVSLQAEPAGDPLARVCEMEAAAGRARLFGCLKPDERRAVGLFAFGFSYREIGEITGWSWTKVNRCLVRGRARLRAGAA